MLRLFVNTLTADKKYSRCNVHNFEQQVQTIISDIIRLGYSPFFQNVSNFMHISEMQWKMEKMSFIF